MREIKFRFGYSDGKNWIFKIFTIEEIMNGEPFDVISDSPTLKKYKMISKDEFTGLKDKNGKEIFEGDIVSGMGKEPNYIVEFSDGCFRGNEINGWDVMVNHFPLSQSVTLSEEIIGNIFENPDLKEGL